MLALRVHRSTLCPGCGNPKATAWHVDNDGHWEAKAEYTCQPCTVRAPEGHPVTFTVVVDTRDYEADPLHGTYTDFGAIDGSIGAAPPPPPPRAAGAAESSLGG